MRQLGSEPPYQQPTPSVEGVGTTESNRRARRTIPTQLAAMAVGVSEATIRKWASRGKLTRYGRPGRAEYDLDELVKLAENMAENR